MVNKPAHFAIYIDDMQRAKNFYGHVFDWGFQSYGATDFLQVTSAKNGGEPIGALQAGHYSPVKEKIIGYECTIAVADIDLVIKKVIGSGGQVVMPKTAIPHVGQIAKFLDTEGNLFCAMQYGV